MGIPQPEDGQPLAYWRSRRAIRNLVWLVGGLVIVYLLGLALEQSRKNAELVQNLKNQQTAFEQSMVDSLAGILIQVQAGVDAAKQAGTTPKITVDQAVAALKKSFPADVVQKAVEKATATTTTTTTTTTSTTAQRLTTTTTAARATTTTTTTTTAPPTTTTTRPCAVGLNLDGLLHTCLIGG